MAGKKSATKRPRTPAQIAATAKLVAARKAATSKASGNNKGVKGT